MARRDEQEVLSPRALNRALIERQMLLRRVPMPPAAAIEHLVGLQAQTPNSYYFGLWSRLDGFRHDDLTRLIVARRAVRIVVMRGTIHLLTPRDCVTLRALTQPMLERAIRGVFGRQLQGVDLGVLAEQGRALLDERPRTASEIGAALARRWPRHDRSALAQAVRGLVPLVQVPPRGLWGATGPAAHVTVERWLGRPVAQGATDRARERLVTRYLAAFGPSTAADLRAWSGLAGLGEIVQRLRPRLRTFQDTAGRELFDLPDASRPDPDVAAPPRFLPEFDNVLLGHADRTRIVPATRRRQLFLGGRPVHRHGADRRVRRRPLADRTDAARGDAHREPVRPPPLSRQSRRSRRRREPGCLRVPGTRGPRRAHRARVVISSRPRRTDRARPHI